MVNTEIVGEIYRSLVILGAEHDLLSTVGSWGDCLTEDQVLSGIKTWNEASIEGIQARIEHYKSTLLGTM